VADGTLYHSWDQVWRREWPTSAFLEVNGKSLAIGQVLERRLPMGIGMIAYALPEIAGSENDPSAIAATVAWLGEFFRQHRLVLLRIELDFPNADEMRRV